tara:strand:- start:8808 stop:9800 length:993 start_codon:yes stop_codon:yes gene_type:complete
MLNAYSTGVSLGLKDRALDQEEMQEQNRLALQNKQLDIRKQQDLFNQEQKAVSSKWNRINEEKKQKSKKQKQAMETIKTLQSLGDYEAAVDYVNDNKALFNLVNDIKYNPKENMATHEEIVPLSNNVIAAYAKKHNLSIEDAERYFDRHNSVRVVTMENLNNGEISRRFIPAFGEKPRSVAEQNLERQNKSIMDSVKGVKSFLDETEGLWGDLKLKALAKTGGKFASDEAKEFTGDVANITELLSRRLTGAAMPEHEKKAFMKLYGLTIDDNKNTILYKMRRVEILMGIDPNKLKNMTVNDFEKNYPDNTESETEGTQGNSQPPGESLFH